MERKAPDARCQISLASSAKVFPVGPNVISRAAMRRGLSNAALTAPHRISPPPGLPGGDESGCQKPKDKVKPRYRRVA